MFKRLTVAAAFVIMVAVYSVSYGGEDNMTAVDNASNTFNENYFIGLKAFEDGFYDVARLSLSDFLASDSKSEQAGFATYLLYQVFMAENDFKNAKKEFDKLSNFNDKRFDKNKIDYDKMFITVKVDCADGEKLLLSDVNNVWMTVYLNSGCAVTPDIVKHVAKKSFTPENLYSVIDKIKDAKELSLLLYTTLPEEKRTPKIINYYGHYFVLNKMMPEFWTLYKAYKDQDMVAFALEDVWNQSDYPRYINLFSSDVQKTYKMPSVAYCRMIEASNKNANKFDCDIVDGCIGVQNPDFKKTKLACYMKNEDKTGIDTFMKNVSSKEAEKLCEYGNYIVGKSLYAVNFLSKFSGCSDKTIMYDSLVSSGDSAGIIELAGKNRTQSDIAYLAIAYSIAGKTKEYEEYVKQITEPILLDMVKQKIGLVK